MSSAIRNIRLHNGLQRVLINEETLQQRIRELGREISDFYGDDEPLLIGVLTGGYMFMADLTRAMSVPLRIDFMAVSSYGDSSSTSGVVRIIKDLDRPVEGRRILIVEDIIDSGLTLSYLMDVLQRRQPADIRLVALLKKDRPREVDVPVDWIGFDIPDEFVVGYGLDFAGKYRNLPFIAIYGPEVLDNAGNSS